MYFTWRIVKLRNIFGHATQVIFSSPEYTLQNRCLLATHNPAMLDQIGKGNVDQEFSQALAFAKEAVALANGGTIDLCPKGIRSAKYAYDGTGH